ncbi:VRR-NUC domain-containing protein [Serratia nevei]|nr:VRR-NUC domain-containing protein [Serratia nevei]
MQTWLSLGYGWLKYYNLDYKLEQNSLNDEIDKTPAVKTIFSKNGGVGGNRPDVKLILKDKKLNSYPILIEYKVHEDKLVNLNVDGLVDNQTSKNEPNFKNMSLCR